MTPYTDRLRAGEYTAEGKEPVRPEDRDTTTDKLEGVTPAKPKAKTTRRAARRR